MQTDIPVKIKRSLLNDPELLDRLQKLDERLQERIIGQREMDRENRNSGHCSSNGKSITTFKLFLLGTTGTGKTETAKALARDLYESENRVLIVDLERLSMKES